MAVKQDEINVFWFRRYYPFLFLILKSWINWMTELTKESITSTRPWQKFMKN
jgi:hypothetical protein